MKQHWVNADGKLHRDDGPAVIDIENNYAAYWINGKLHRDDGPAVIDKNKKQWFINGVRHRDDGPAISYPDIGYYIYIRHGLLHRNKDDGPAWYSTLHNKLAYWENGELLESHELHTHQDESTTIYRK